MKKQDDEFMTPNELLIKIVAQLAYQQAMLENIMDMVDPKGSGFIQFVDLEPKRKRIFVNRAKKEIRKLLIPMFAYMAPQSSVIEEEEKGKKTQQLPVIEEELSPEHVDAVLLPENDGLHQETVFYNEKTTVLA
jgi:hypothetical protein